MDTVTPEPTCDAPIKTADGTVVATCNLRPGHLGKCREVCWEIAGPKLMEAKSAVLANSMRGGWKSAPICEMCGMTRKQGPHGDEEGARHDFVVPREIAGRP